MKFLPYILLILLACSESKMRKVSYYESGRIKSEGTCIGGKKDGSWVFYDSEGDTTKIEYFEYDSLLYEISFANNIRFSKSDYSEGLLTIYGKNGSIECIVGIRNNQNHGEYTCYFPDGTISRKGNYQNGIEKGNFTQYHPNGEIYVSAENVGEGIYQFYDSLGNLTYEIQFIGFKPTDTLYRATK